MTNYYETIVSARSSSTTYKPGGHTSVRVAVEDDVVHTAFGHPIGAVTVKASSVMLCKDCRGRQESENEVDEMAHFTSRQSRVVCLRDCEECETMKVCDE